MKSDTNYRSSRMILKQDLHSIEFLFKVRAGD